MLLDISFEYIVIAVDALDAELGDEVGRATLLFKLCDADTEVLEFIRILRGELGEGLLLGRIQCVFLRHQTGDDLRDLITGDMLVSAEGAVRIAVDDALIGERGDGLIGPVVSRYVGEWIRCAYGHCGAGEAGCNGCFQKSVFHGSSLLKSEPLSPWCALDFSCKNVILKLTDIMCIIFYLQN